MSAPSRAPDLQSLLVIKPSSLGDIVHGLQLIQSVARQMPACRITWVARDRFALLPRSAPFVHEVIPFRRKAGARGMMEVLRTLRRRRFDAVWDLQGLFRSGLMTLAARSPEKWGRRDCREGSGLFYNRRIDLPAAAGNHHALAVLQGFPRALGLDDTVAVPLNLRPAPPFGWKSFFQGDPSNQFVVFTDSRGAGKQWPKFDALTRMIWERIPGSRVAWCAGGRVEPGEPVPEGRFLNLTGCPLDEMIELVRQPSIFIGNDSGPMHLSAAFGNRVVAIFVSTAPERFGPWPPDSDRTKCVVAPDGRADALEPEEVFANIMKVREAKGLAPARA